MSTSFIEQKAILPPNCEAKPPTPLDPKYKPPNSQPYYVKQGDHWGTVAEYAKMEPAKLIEYNFNTNVYAHVNWYLHNHVGCTTISSDKSNFSFSNLDITREWAAHPGIVYVPAVVPPPKPVPIPVPVPPPDVSMGCQDLLFSMRFHAESFVGEAAIIAAEKANDLGLLTKFGDLGMEVLNAIDRIWLISGIMSMEIDGYDDGSTYCWKFGGLMTAFWTAPFTGNTDYDTGYKRIRMNLDVLDPRGYWDYNHVEFTLARSSIAVEVRHALAQNPSPYYRPFPDQVLTSSRNLTFSMPLRQNGPLGLVTSLPGESCILKPLGYLTEQVAYKNIQDALRRLKQQVGL